ncbi:thrombospondin-related apical membrane protein, putative [Plasmodium vinckei brucechwatti]|uniref:Thrombospondin-related apical membrane protein, putative n=1 Tax=Plasmodium vinckei brucechwatti TaxID=119398 RepID=A0A6V7SZH7_PLAVN|nr:thrombospondin-related apical membrane protein, putative [Plasmodium vinckei brucechwatti]
MIKMGRFSIILISFFFLTFHKEICGNFDMRKNEDPVVQLLQTTPNYKVVVLEPECFVNPKTKKLMNSGNYKDEENFDRKEFLMYNYIVINNYEFSNAKSLEIYSAKDKNITNYLILTFYIEGLNFSVNKNFLYDIFLHLSTSGDNKKMECTNKYFDVSLLKSIDVLSPSELEILSDPIKFTMGTDSGSFRINITQMFMDDTWKAFIKNKISFLIKPEGDCYVLLEDRLNKPTLVIEKISSFYTEWGEWSQCTMECNHPDNVQIRERRCIHPNGDCFKGDLKESRPCNVPLPPCYSLFENKDSSTLKIMMVALPIFIVICVFIILYRIFYAKKGTEKELYENVAGRFMYE